MTTAMPVGSPGDELPVISDREREILRLIREIGYGKVLITVKNGQPVHAELQKSILLQELNG